MRRDRKEDEEGDGAEDERSSDRRRNAFDSPE